MSSSARRASTIAASVGMPVWSWRISGDAAVPPSMPSTTTTSAPHLAASFTSSNDARRADLHEDRDLPVGRLAQLLDLDDHVVRAEEVRVARRRALVDAGRQVADRRRSRRDTFEPSSRPPVPGFAPWPIVSSIASACAQVMDVGAVAARQHLDDHRSWSSRARPGACRRRPRWSSVPTALAPRARARPSR